MLDQREQHVLAASRAQVERDELLVARLHRPPQRPSPVVRPAPLAQHVGAPGILDLDDLGAHVAEQAPGERPRDKAAELEHAYTGEGPIAPPRLGCPPLRSHLRFTKHGPGVAFCRGLWYKTQLTDLLSA